MSMLKEMRVYVCEKVHGQVATTESRPVGVHTWNVANSAEHSRAVVDIERISLGYTIGQKIGKARSTEERAVVEWEFAGDKADTMA